MGLSCTLYRVTTADVARFIQDPASVREFIFSDDENWQIEKPRGLLGLLLRFTPLSIETATRKEPLTDEEWIRLKEIECDLEGTWHGLQFLFTGTAWEGDEPACYLVQGGEDVDGEDFDQPPRLLQPRQVQEFSRFLIALTEDELRRRYNPDRMKELSIAPESLWTRSSPDGDRGLDMLLESLDELRVFVSRAATAGDRLIVFLA